ncbi:MULTISPECIES: FAD-dependent oxidoreductase [Streptacidiphilus]|uniref:FAD-dependent oxidoreductase n=1 Tax=Streptacidiphilus cavernicola TaxID=3342716 RepID=A0ABV6UMD1_9ACTN|nr:FAD-dependent oxidoreductase [Streptacidiphilus jeojiense]
MAHVVVVGGGVMGSAAAWQLASRGFAVTLLERGAAGHTEGSSHGSSRIFRLAYPDAFYVSLAARALPLWRRLEAESGIEVLSLTGAVDHGPPAAIEALHGELRAGGHAARVLGPEQAAERWPGLRFDTSVLFHAAAGRLHADRAVLAFQQAAAAKGAVVRHGVRVAKLLRHGADKVEVVTTGGEAVTADAAVVAVGGWAPGLAARSVSGLPPLRVTQEQPVHFPAPDALDWPSFIHHGGAALAGDSGVYGLGSEDGVKAGFHAVGPVVDPDRRDRSIDPLALRQVQEYAERWLLGVDASAPTATTCLYTLTPEHDFVVDRDGPVTVLAGFSGHGFKFASVIGELAADLVTGRPGARRFSLGRTDPARADPERADLGRTDQARTDGGKTA